MSEQSRALARVAIGGAFLINLCMLAPSTAHARCQVVAESPTVSRIMGTRAIVGVGKRGPDCTVGKVLYVQLRQDRLLWPDKTLAEVRFTVTNARLRVRYPCRVLSGKEVFTKTWVQGDHPDESARVAFNC